MNRYEFQRRLDDGEDLIESGRYSEAVDILDTIDLNQLEQPRELQLIAKAYEKCKRYKDAEEILLLARDYVPRSRSITFHLCSAALKGGNLEDAKEYYNDFEQIAKGSPERFVLQYRLAQAEQKPDEELIGILCAYRDEEPDDRWMYELACLYRKTGQTEKAIEVCEDVELWFDSGKYVNRTKELHAQLDDTYVPEPEAPEEPEKTEEPEEPEEPETPAEYAEAESTAAPSALEEPAVYGRPEQKTREITAVQPEENTQISENAEEPAEKEIPEETAEAQKPEETETENYYTSSYEIPKPRKPFLSIFHRGKREEQENEQQEKAVQPENTPAEQQEFFSEISWPAELAIETAQETVQPEEPAHETQWTEEPVPELIPEEPAEEVIPETRAEDAEIPEASAEEWAVPEEHIEEPEIPEASAEEWTVPEERVEEPEIPEAIVQDIEVSEEPDNETETAEEPAEAAEPVETADEAYAEETEAPAENLRERVSAEIYFQETPLILPEEDMTDELDLSDGISFVMDVDMIADQEPEETYEPEFPDFAAAVPEVEAEPVEEPEEDIPEAEEELEEEDVPDAEEESEEEEIPDAEEEEESEEERWDTEAASLIAAEEAAFESTEDMSAIEDVFADQQEEADGEDDDDEEKRRREEESRLFGNLPMEPEMAPEIWHFMVFGESDELTLEYARDIMKRIREENPSCPGKMLKIGAKRIGEASIVNSLDRFLGNMVVVEQAASLSDEQLREFVKVLEKDDRSLLVAFTDERSDMIRMFERVPELAESFTAVYEGKRYTARDLVDVAKEYLHTQEARPTREAEAVIFDYAKKLLEENNGFYVSDIRRYADEALFFADRGSLFRFSGGKIDEEGYLIVTEKHFRKAEAR